MMSPLAKGLFHGAIDMSGSYVYNASLESAEKDNLEFLKKTGCKNADCLRKLNITQVLQVRKFMAELVTFHRLTNNSLNLLASSSVNTL